MELHPYLSFEGNAREAVELYARALNGKVEFVTTYADNPEMLKSLPSDWENKVMHASMTAGAITIMASDVIVGENGPCAIKELSPSGSPVSLSVNCNSVAELQAAFAVLADGGVVTMEPQDTFWGAHFAMLVDKFGIKWMFNHDYPQK